MTEPREWKDEDVGTVIEKLVTPSGTYLNVEIVQVHCLSCGAEFIGPVREAGGFIGGHDCYHMWQLRKEMDEDGGMTA